MQCQKLAVYEVISNSSYQQKMHKNAQEGVIFLFEDFVFSFNTK